MKYQETIEQSAELLRMIITSMAQHDAAFHPISYSVWYECLATLNVPLQQAIDGACKTETRLSEQTVRTLYQKYIAEVDEALAAHAAKQFQQILSDMTTTTDIARFESKTYESALMQWQTETQDQSVPDRLQAGVTVLLRDTQTMQKTLATLQNTLDSSANAIDELKRELSRARSEALTDALTGLVNRKGLDQSLDALLSLWELDSPPFCLVMIDIDHFKRINDSYGHLMGDKVLRAVAQMLKAAVRGSTTVARYGGEEFAIVLPQTSAPDCFAIVERLRLGIAKSRIRKVTSNEMIDSITISAGIACYRPDESISDLLGRADAALYQSKRGGRNRTTMAS